VGILACPTWMGFRADLVAEDKVKDGITRTVNGLAE